MKLEKVAEQSEITRRGFCNRMLFTSAGLLIGANELRAQKTSQQSPLVFYPPVKIEGAPQVLPGSFLYFNYPRANDPAVLVRAEDGEYLAYNRKCAHLGCSVDYDDAHRCFMCPCHRGAYDVFSDRVSARALMNPFGSLLHEGIRPQRSILARVCGSRSRMAGTV